jgi:hypothetical protein
MINISQYKFYPGETGLFVEIYLPKKAVYQGALYDALTEGFILDNVKTHFRENTESVKQFLNDHRICQYLTEDGISNLVGVFRGYSMYEVDGVFYDMGVISEERSQVIRIIFRIELDKIPSSLSKDSKLKIVKDYLRYTGTMKDFLKECIENEEPALEGESQKVFDYLRMWVGEAALFTFGYVLYKICHVIEKKGNVKEAEIWVTSFWNLVVDRVIKEK